MSYPGNPSLGQETKARILDTFHQTLELATRGRTQEAALGCDFILKMDPLFKPAAKLQSRLQGASGPIDVADLALESAASEALPVEEAVVAAEATIVEAATESAPAAIAAPPEAVPVIEAIPISDDGMAELPLVDAVGATQAPNTESQDRIGELLEEGQSRYDDGDFQAAIDAWSRIFLIDIENQEAARRIELARKLKDEQERRVDELFHEAVGHREAGRTAEARATLEKVLELNPQHLSAREVLDQLGDPSAIEAPPMPLAEGVSAEEAEAAGGLEALEAPAPSGAQVGEPAPPEESTGLEEEAGLFDPGDFEEGGEDVVSPPSRGGGIAVAKPQRSFRAIAAIGLVVILGGGYLLYSNRDRLFPNASEEVPAAAAPAAPDPIKVATRLHLDGDTQGAIDQLSELTEDHPSYARAQQQIALWRQSLPPEEESAEVPEESPDEGVDLELREELLEEARALYGRREYLRAAKAFRRAERIQPLDGAASDLFQDTKRQLLPIASQIDLFQQREWERLLPTLWRMLEAEPANRDIRLLLADSYFNLGVMDLRRNSPSKALEKFKETTQLIPDDQDGARLLKFAEAYTGREIDALYRVFVKNLEFRR